MSQTQSSRTPRSTTAVDAVQSPRTGAGSRTARGFAVFAALAVAVAVTALAPALTAAVVVSAGVTATTVAAVRSAPDRTTDPPDSSESTRRSAAHAAD